MKIHTYIFLFLPNLSLCIDITYQVEEGQRPDTYIGNIAADIQLENIPLKDRALIWFSQLKEGINNTLWLFNVSRTGKLYTAQQLDTEALCKYNTECFRTVDIAVQNKESFVKILEIKVILKDVNDHRPEFPEDHVKIEFSEDDRKGVRRSIANAIDKDVGIQNSQIVYWMKNEHGQPFSLSVSKKIDGTATLGIILEQRLDREMEDEYNIQIVAKDQGFPPKQSILNVHVSITDVNDNPPRFAKNVYNVSLNNGFRKNKPITTLSATDLDSGENGKISYYFGSKTSNNAKSYFKLVKETGEIFLIQKYFSGSKKIHKLFIEAVDGGIPPLSSTVMVLVNIINQQNNIPKIEVKFVSQSSGNKLTISEGIKVGSFIAFVKIIDDDIGQNGEVDCFLQHDKLQLQSLGKMKYKVIVKSEIDRETESHIEFDITCKDRGSPSLQTQSQFSIEVVDINDVRPMFTKDTFKFLAYENEKSNFLVGFINATDPDLGPENKLYYSLYSKDQYVLPFEISDFGFISTTQSLDREQQEIYKFQVSVKDSGIPPLNNTANVIVKVMDENDNVPYFTFPSVNPFSLDVHYHPQINKDITVLRASDRDSHVNAFLTYEIVKGNDKQLFNVNPHSGVLSFSRPVYQNDAGSYDLQFVVRDSGTPVLSATTTVFLTLTVSNSTSQLYTAQHTESDDMIHISLVVIIVIAAVIISTAIVVSIIVCIVQRQNQREVQYGYRIDANNDLVGERRPSEYICEPISPKYDIPFTIVGDQVSNRNCQITVPKRETHSGYKSEPNLEGSASGFQMQTITKGDSQAATVASNIGREGHMIASSDDFCRKSMSSHIDKGQGQKEGNTQLYQELLGRKLCQIEQPQNSSKTSSLPRDSNINVKVCYPTKIGQNTPCNDVIDLKSIRVTGTSSISSQPWNLPTKNSFTSYIKPLPALPKLPYSPT
ncbi:protocadherin beta-2-like isoform X2 [Octopus vulgaris]|uniref:Protocadherin beta-2-like isoform X2 n=1 Tax=Octopus vulgaris TaxID=6645 RepID=A0AA36BEX1_OCTVU|nr:protocadherin beta-2-like isoform X2 [Octopus vulgaris]